MKFLAKNIFDGQMRRKVPTKDFFGAEHFDEELSREYFRLKDFFAWSLPQFFIVGQTSFIQPTKNITAKIFLANTF
jgi:hypothetical protein